MRLTESLELQPPAGVRWIARTLEEAGHQAWAVGGTVRDEMVARAAAEGRPWAVQRLGGRAPAHRSDWDLATSAPPATVRSLFRRTVPIGIEHGTVGVLDREGRMYETTTFRRDVETFGRHAVVAFAETLEEDLARRDFTINALAWHPLTHELRDPYGGLADLEAGRLRTVGEPAERFAEDWLRVLRALRFAGHFLMEVDAGTWAAMEAAPPHLGKLSAERVREELWKVLGKTRHASAALRLYRESGVLGVLYPELQALVGFQVQEGDARDVWSASLAAVDAASTGRVTLRVAALYHAVGMPVARARDLRGGWRYVGHEVMGGRKAEDAMARLKASNADRDTVAWLVTHQSDLFPPDAPPAGVRRWLRDTGPQRVNDLFRLRFALQRARPEPRGARELTERWRMAHRELQAHPPLAVGDLAIDGADLRALGMEPGPGMGAMLRGLLERVLDDPALNTRDRLRALAAAALEEGAP